MMSRDSETSSNINQQLECPFLPQSTNPVECITVTIAEPLKEYEQILPQASPTLTPDSLPAASPNPKLNSLATYFPCRHTTSTKFETSTFCKECGARMYKEGDVLALKSSNMSYLAAVSPIRFYRNTFHNNSKKLDGLGISLMNFPEYMKQRERTINYIIDLGERMHICKQALFLSISYLDYLVVNEVTSACCNMMVKEHLCMFGGVCLMLAAKSVELDDRIPFLSTLKKYIQLTLYTKEDLRKAEQKVIETLNFCMHIPTIFDILDYYASQGVVFSDDTQKTISLSPSTSASSADSANSQTKKPSNSKKSTHRVTELKFFDQKHSSDKKPIPTEITDIPQIIEENSNTTESDTNGQAQEEQIGLEDNPVQNSCIPGSTEIAATPICTSENTVQPESVELQSPPCNDLPPVAAAAASPAQSPSPTFQECEISSLKFYDIVQKVERDLHRVALLSIKDVNFYDFNLEVLGAACVGYIREKHALWKPFREEILEISNQPLESQKECCSVFLSKFDTHFQNPGFLSMSSSYNYSVSPLKDSRTTLKFSSFGGEQFKAPASALPMTTGIIRNHNLENKKPARSKYIFSIWNCQQHDELIGDDHIASFGELNSLKVRDKSFESFSSQYHSLRHANSFQHISSKPTNGLISTRTLFSDTHNSFKTTSLAHNSNASNNNSSSIMFTNNHNTSGNISTQTSFHSKLLQASHSSSSSSQLVDNPSLLSKQQSAVSKTQSLVSNISSFQSSFSKPFSLVGINPLNQKVPNKTVASIPSFEDEAKWNSHFDKTTQSISFRANTFSSRSFLRKNQF